MSMLRQPMWRINLAICATLVALVAGYFFYQVRAASDQFRRNSREHSRVLAAAVELNLRNAMRSNEGLELVIRDFLRNSAHFIAYLDTIEHFDSLELAAFAREAGLAGITIIGGDGEPRVEGPASWGPEAACNAGGELRRHPAEHIYTLVYPLQAEAPERAAAGCVIVGFSSLAVEKVQEDISVATLLAHLAELPGIVSVQLVEAEATPEAREPQSARLVEQDGHRYSETRLRIGDRDLVVTQAAGHFAKRLAQMRSEFLLFVAFLAAFGGVSSWWLYHAERLRLREAREYEQEMARQHEAAALGRAAATIAHEIRNPLNAIGMGLQRLQLETEGLDEEHLQLLAAMREAVARSNTIVTSLQQYVRPFEITFAQVAIAGLIREVVQLYQPACRQQGIEVVLEAEGDYTASGDRVLLGHLFENLVKNAVEAQPGGGFLRIGVRQTEKLLTVSVANGGYRLSAAEGSNLFEPYFTSKTQGTGLGLAISRKIVEAHGGAITARPDPAAQTLTLLIELPSASRSEMPAQPTQERAA